MSNAVTIDIRGQNQQLKSALSGSESLVKGFGSKIGAAFVGIGAAIGAAMSVRMVFDWGKSFIDAAARAEEATTKLDSVLTATGRASGFATDQLVGFADSLQQVTKFESETTQEAMAVIATFKNIRGDNFLAATKAAQDMSTVLGGDLSSSAMQLGKALNDPEQGLTALSRAGISFTDSQKATIKAMQASGDMAGAQALILKELQSEFGGAAEKAGGTFAGQMEILKNRFGDMAETVGEMLIPFLQMMGPVVDNIATAIENLLPTVETWATLIRTEMIVTLRQLQPLLDWFVDAGVTAFSLVSVAIQNWQDVSELAFDMFLLSLVKTFNEVTHFLTKVIPDHLEWFAENWTRIFEDIATFQGTVLMNMGKNLVDFFLVVKDWLQGKGGEFKFTSLTEGFEATIDELPGIAERIPTALENTLGKRVNELGGSLSDKLGNTFNETKAFLDGLLDKEEHELDLENTASDEFDTDPAKAKKEKAAKKARATKKEKEPKEPKEHVATFEDLFSLHSRIAAAAASESKKETDPTVPILEKQNSHLETISATLIKSVFTEEEMKLAAQETAAKIADVGVLY